MQCLIYFSDLVQMDGVHIKSNFTYENNDRGEDETNNSIENASDERVMTLDNMELSPCTCMEFNSYVEAYTFYNNCAKEAGFGINDFLLVSSIFFYLRLAIFQYLIFFLFYIQEISLAGIC